MAFDCSKCIAKCKAVCCTAIPLPNELFEKHKPIRKIVKLLDDGQGCSLPVTEDGYCPFLGKDMKCSIYQDRPWICQVYGKGGHIDLECAFQAPDGRIRSRQERREIERKVKESIDYINKIKTGKVDKKEAIKYQMQVLRGLPPDVRSMVIKELLSGNNPLTK